MAIVLREAEPKDVTVIFTMIKELAEFEKLLSEVSATEELLKDYLFGEKKYAEVILAYLDDSPVGFALFFHNFSTFLGKPGIYLEDLYVRPVARGQGIGLTLIKHLANIAKERKCGRMEWSVLDWNTPAIQFYQKIGAKPNAEWTVYRMTEDAIDKFTSE